MTSTKSLLLGTAVVLASFTLSERAQASSLGSCSRGTNNTYWGGTCGGGSFKDGVAALTRSVRSIERSTPDDGVDGPGDGDDGHGKGHHGHHGGEGGHDGHHGHGDHGHDGGGH